MTQKRTRIFLIVATVIFSLGGLLGILPAITSVFLFDSPGSEKNPATIILFANALTFPLACLTSIVASWVLYALKRYTACVRHGALAARERCDRCRRARLARGL